ncbi:MAG: hypothetical protein RBR50_11160 [Candidatus Izemoplasmatales bacterium]|jgi:hypothetical protein|nr:hypothetical protein [Candidatus Izemoplasmatales bacterium]
MKNLSKKIKVFAILSLFGFGLFSAINNDRKIMQTNAADYLSNVATFVEGTAAGQYADSTASGDLNVDWDWTGIKNSGSTITRTYNNDLRFYYSSTGDGSSVLLSPDSTNTNKVFTRVKFITRDITHVTAITASAGMTQAGMSDVGSIAFTVGETTATYEYIDLAGFRYFELQNANTTNTQLYIQSIEFDYMDIVYDPVTSLDSNITSPHTIYVGETLIINPTILPSTANQGFTLSTENAAIEILGSSIKGSSVANGVSVTVTTLGKTTSDLTISEVVTFNVIQATTTVAEALTLTPGTGIVYEVTNAAVSDGYNTAYDRQIQLVDSVDPTKNILIFDYGINPKNSYRYITGGTISFKATLGSYESVNQFTDPIITSYVDNVETFADSILVGDTLDQCITRFPDYKTTVLAFDTVELAKLQLGTDADISNARARYLAWAAALGELPYEAGSSPMQSIDNTNENLNIVLLIALIGCTGIAGLYFKSRKYSK